MKIISKLIENYKEKKIIIKFSIKNHLKLMKKINLINKKIIKKFIKINKNYFKIN